MSEFRLGRLLGVGREAEVFEFGDNVVKLYRPSASKLFAFREAANITAAHLLGLPAPETFGLQTFDGRWGIVMAKVDRPLFGDRLESEPAAKEKILARMADLQLLLHRHARRISSPSNRDSKRISPKPIWTRLCEKDCSIYWISAPMGTASAMVIFIRSTFSAPLTSQHWSTGSTLREGTQPPTFVGRMCS
jgi:hypothetical protein